MDGAIDGTDGTDATDRPDATDGTGATDGTDGTDARESTLEEKSIDAVTPLPTDPLPAVLFNAC